MRRADFRQDNRNSHSFLFPELKMQRRKDMIPSEFQKEIAQAGLRKGSDCRKLLRTPKKWKDALRIEKMK